MNLHQQIETARVTADRLRSLGATYLYDGVFVYHDGFQYWLCTETGDEIALEPRTLSMFMDYVKERG